MIACDIQPIQNLKVLNYVGEERKREFANHFIEAGLLAVESYVSRTAGRFCVGGRVKVCSILKSNPLLQKLTRREKKNSSLRILKKIRRVEHGRYLLNPTAIQCQKI